MAHRPTTSNFSDSQEATFRRCIRSSVRDSNLTRGEKEIALAFLNHWFVHRRDGAVYPGRKKLAKRTGASMRAVNYAFCLFRDFGAITAVAYATGNADGERGKATEYTVDTIRLIALCEAPTAVLKAWRQARIHAPAGNTGCKIARLKGAKIAPRNNPCNVLAFPVQGFGS